MRRRHFSRRGRFFPRKDFPQKALFIISIAVMIYGIMLSVLYERAMPVAEQLARIRAETVISAIVSEAASQNGISDYSEYRYSDTGFLTGVISNTAQMNKFRADVINETARRFSSGNISVSVPFGTLTGSAVLSGLGPPLTVYFDGYYALTADFVYENDPVGINSGCFTVSLRVTVKAKLLLPKGRTSDVAVQTTVPVERVVISGRM